MSFMQFWPGQIDATRDLLPTIAKPPEHAAHAVHLRRGGNSRGPHSPAASPRETSSVPRTTDYQKYFNYFSNERKFSLPSSLGKIIGKPVLFSLTNSWAKFYQVDKLREAGQLEKEF